MLAAQTVTKTEFCTSQTHEFEAIKIFLSLLFKQKVLTVVLFSMPLDYM